MSGAPSGGPPSDNAASRGLRANLQAGAGGLRVAGLKLSAASRGESLILKEREQLRMRSLTPQQATGNALATGFKNVQMRGC